MNHVRYRLETLPAALNTRKMHGATDRFLTTRRPAPWILVTTLATAALVFHTARPPETTREATTPNTPNTPNTSSSTIPTERALVSLLAATRTEAARAKLEQNRPGEALAILAGALATDPECAPARDLARKILATTVWNFPETTLRHGQANIDHLEFAPPSTLWVSLSGDSNTLVKWNLDSLEIENVLFPLDVPQTRSLTFDSGHRLVVVERGGFALLCDALTLKPIRNLGALPPSLTPSSVVAFSPNGLLAAHPGLEDGSETSIIWQVRDTATGEIVRRSEPPGPDSPAPLAAHLDHHALRVFREDGSVWTMPVSPAAAVDVTPPQEDAGFLHARFSETGSSLMALKDLGPHASPTLQAIDFSYGSEPPLAALEFLELEPWTVQPSLWTGLMRRTEAPLRIRENLAIVTDGRAPLQAAAPITAATFRGDMSFIAGRHGEVTVFRSLPGPNGTSTPTPTGAPDPADLGSLKLLIEFLTGESCDESGGNLAESSRERRLQAFKDCDFDAVSRVFPELDFTPVIHSTQSLAPRDSSPDSLVKLTQRLNRAVPVPADSDTQTGLAALFKKGDSPAIQAAIQAAGGKGPIAAKALELALDSNQPEWIDACLTHANDLPPVLHRLAISRIAWLQDRRAAALAAWADGFPDLKQVRLSEDWDGWEQADFSGAMQALHHCLAEELAALEVPANSTPEQRKTIFERLTDPATIKAVGRARFARACTHAAIAFSAFDEEAGSTVKLANLARSLGDESTPCLRAEAYSHTTLGNYAEARDLWVSLLTEHPADSHLPADYTEAAYTAFECGDPQQAAAILTTGVRAFPNDAEFALRAGWIALLTGNAEQAYRFLLAGDQIGYPQGKLENAIALLAAAAVQVGAIDDANVYYQDLIRLDPAWQDSATIETLEWPEELKAALRQLTW